MNNCIANRPASAFPTAIMRINHPIHQGRQNPVHGMFFFVGAIPAACYDQKRCGSLRYETEEAAIDAAILGGAERIQDTRCAFVDIESRRAAMAAAS